MRAERGDAWWLPVGFVALLTALFAAQVLEQGAGPTAWASVVLWAGLMLFYLGAGYTRATDALRAWVLQGPGRVYVLPVLLFVVYLGYARAVGTLSEDGVVAAVAFLIIPVEIARRDTLPWRDRDLFLGWAALLVPLVGPLSGDQPPAVEIALRAGAFALPGLFVWLARGRWQGVRFLLAVTFLWYSVEFDSIPRVGFPLVSLFKLYALVLVIYLLLITDRLQEIGYGLRVRLGEVRIAAREFLFFMPFALAIGIATGFLHPQLRLPDPVEAAVSALLIFVFTGLPEEILFRGIIHGFIAQYVSNSTQALLISSLIFGAAHLNNPPMVLVYFALASIAGWFYGRAYVHTGRIAPAALVHTAVDWVWGLWL